jgi:hypothetical protein
VATPAAVRKLLSMARRSVDGSEREALANFVA